MLNLLTDVNLNSFFELVVLLGCYSKLFLDRPTVFMHAHYLHCIFLPFDYRGFIYAVLLYNVAKSP